ncbi:unnamed protein product [Larinioides sclopetarius]|uniref:Uncharacterized protein n=1 Tax=Larinioides sclopetarius TaxID=280406 RepID=A0AAV2AR78_9ARAC
MFIIRFIQKVKHMNVSYVVKVLLVKIIYKGIMVLMYLKAQSVDISKKFPFGFFIHSISNICGSVLFHLL